MYKIADYRNGSVKTEPYKKRKNSQEFTFENSTRVIYKTFETIKKRKC